jgi:hypothetical protein
VSSKRERERERESEELNRDREGRSFHQLGSFALVKSMWHPNETTSCQRAVLHFKWFNYHEEDYIRRSAK